MANYNSKKRKKGANVKPIEEMVDKEKTSADSYFEKLEESKNNKKVVDDMKNVNDVEIVNEVEKELKEEMLNELYESEVVVDEEALRQKEIVDSHIKVALYKSKGLGKRGILSKQYKSIVNGYKREVGFDMTKEQEEFLKTITEMQAVEVIKVLNAYNRYKVNKEIQRRIEARKLATNE